MPVVLHKPLNALEHYGTESLVARIFGARAQELIVNGTAGDTDPVNIRESAERVGSKVSKFNLEMPGLKRPAPCAKLRP